MSDSHVTISKPEDETTEIICIIDRSTSIKTSGLVERTIEGFNSFINEQKQLPGKAVVTLCLFDGDGGYGSRDSAPYELLHEGISLADVPELNTSTYVPKGMTAMYDAIGITIDNTYKRIMSLDSKPDKVVVLIMTDGEENASKEYTKGGVLDLIKERTEKDQWAFIFIGANIDTMKAGHGIGVSSGNTLAYSNSGDGVKTAYSNMSKSVGKMRSMSKFSLSSVDMDNLIKENGADKEDLAGNK